MPRMRLPATLAVTAGLTGLAQAQAPRVEDQLARAPVFAGVQVTMPAGADLAACRSEAVAGLTKPATGSRVLDSQGRLVRQFIDTTGAGRPNIVYYYLNGVESYRETRRQRQRQARPVPLARRQRRQVGRRRR